VIVVSEKPWKSVHVAIDDASHIVFSKVMKNEQ
jgi:hypothetical protein